VEWSAIEERIIARFAEVFEMTLEEEAQTVASER
jgi:hypothetical protein